MYFPQNPYYGVKIMSSDSLPIVISVLFGRKDRNQITVPISILKENNPNYVKIGILQREVNCKPNNTSNVIEMTPYLIQSLGLKKGFKCHARIKTNTLHLGPVIGAFVGSSYTNRLLFTQRAKDRSMDLIKANQVANTILYFFSPKDIRVKQRKVRGTYYDVKQRRWKTHLFPFPSVLYDRGSGMTRKRLPLQRVRSKIEANTPVKKINSQHYFDKWDLYRKLHKFSEIRPYIPETILYRSPSDLKKIFTLSNKVYVKRLVSSNGFKILCVEKISSGYKCSTFTSRVKNYYARNLDEVDRTIRRMYGYGKVLLQQGIDLIKIQNRNVDMRATVQRDGKGELGITDITVRVGENGSPVTSTRSGSRCIPFRKFFEKQLKFSKEEVNKLEANIFQFLLKVYECTEKAYGSFGEIGIDFAIDKKGNIYLIECNAKPAKTSLSKSADRKTRRKAFINPLDYAKFINGF